MEVNLGQRKFKSVLKPETPQDKILQFTHPISQFGIEQRLENGEHHVKHIGLVDNVHTFQTDRDAILETKNFATQRKDQKLCDVLIGLPICQAAAKEGHRPPVDSTHLHPFDDRLGEAGCELPDMREGQAVHVQDDLHARDLCSRLGDGRLEHHHDALEDLVE